MKEILVGVCAGGALTRETAVAADYVEIKNVTEDEVRRVRGISEKPLLFHIQYAGGELETVPSVADMGGILPRVARAYEAARPALISLHFGPAAVRASLDGENYVAVAKSGPLSREEILEGLEKNLRALRLVFPGSGLLIENLEFIPEALSRGAYRYVQEPDFFTPAVSRWYAIGILDGIVFDIAHGLIASGNHPYYNGLFIKPEDTGPSYLPMLKERNDLLNYFRSYTSGMPLHLIREIHISGINRLSNGVWVDSHREIGTRELDALALVLRSLEWQEPGPLYITLEYTRDAHKIPPQLNTLKTFANSFVSKPAAEKQR